MKYRSEIDGLRALAVIPVILFHAGFELFSGGFVGVDVFFVISGYLITTILIEDIEKDRFSLVNFYERRARRILPALFFVMLVCIPFAWMWMTPSQLQDFSQSLVAVSLFASNILFWQESDYFETAAEEKPLLHTWSLAVEEQYYVLFPIFLLLTWRFGKKRVFWTIVALAMISLAGSEWGWRNRAVANFYLAPTRVWELLAGSITAFIVQKRGVQSNDLLSLMGLAAIVFTIFAYDENTPFPSVYALVPVLGVVLLILFATKETIASKILSTKLFVGLGLISYSAYLWHQPLFAFLRINHVNKPEPIMWAVLVALSILLAFLSWKYIEQPFRNREKFDRRKIFVMSFVGMILFISVGILGSFHADKFNPGGLNSLNEYDFSSENNKLQTDSWGPLNTLSGGQGYGVDNNEFDKKDWFDGENGKSELLVVGNSHSKDLYNVLINSSSLSDNYNITRYGVQIRDISDRHSIWKSPNYLDAEYMIIVSRYNEGDIERLKGVATRAEADNKKVVIVKNTFEFEQFRTGNWTLGDKISYTVFSSEIPNSSLVQKVNEEYFRHYKNGNTSDTVKQVNRRLEGLGESLGIPVLDRMDYACDASASICYAMNEAGEKLYYDYGHNTLAGGKFFGKRVDMTNWLGLRD